MRYQEGLVGQQRAPFPLHPERAGAPSADPVSTQAKRLRALSVSLPVSLRGPYPLELFQRA